jgi:DNA-directed RNA polymerase specialized sigma24 family protein
MWLDADRSKAGEKYEQIRQRLIKVFVRRGCPIAEELADETIDRVSRKAAEIGDSYVGDPAAYFCGVAQKVFLEYVKPRPVGRPVPLPSPPEDRERNVQCLERCMEQLDSESHELILEYYQYEKLAKIARRKELAEQRGVTVNTLRMRAHRIKATLASCVRECITQAPA